MKDTSLIYGRNFLKAMAAEHGWTFSELAFATKVWVTKHVGLILVRKGHHDDAGWKLVVKTLVPDVRYSELARGWRKLTGIEEEDRRSILELVSTFPDKEAIIEHAELRMQEILTRKERQRKALAARAAVFKEKTGAQLWVSEYGPPEARDEPYKADYERPPGWLKSLVVTPEAGKFILEVPDEDENLERVFRAIQEVQRTLIVIK